MSVTFAIGSKTDIPKYMSVYGDKTLDLSTVWWFYTTLHQGQQHCVMTSTFLLNFYENLDVFCGRQHTLFHGIFFYP